MVSAYFSNMDAEHEPRKPHDHESMSAVNITYHSYLVRLWQQAPNGPWRASAQSVQSGQALHFADLKALFQFLEVQIAARASQPDQPK